MRRALTPRTRAILVVNPNNPTGSFLKRDETRALVALAAERASPIISDEVFADYGFAPDEDRVTTLAAELACLTFCLSGLSKLVGLPQLKLGWIVANGPAARARRSARSGSSTSPTRTCRWRRRCSTPRRRCSRSSTTWARRSPRACAKIARRWSRALAGRAAQLYDAEGGWSAVVRLPSTHTEEECALALLDDGVLVHPGFFFDLPPTSVVVSLLVTPAALNAALPAILRRCTR